jgi:hypothetical protein
MIEQIDFGTREEYLLAEEATERGITGVVNDLNDQLTIICGLATLGAEASYDAERTENYFALIESASTKAAQITRQLLVLDLPHPADDAPDGPTRPEPARSSFRRRLTAARAELTRRPAA